LQTLLAWNPPRRRRLTWDFDGWLVIEVSDPLGSWSSIGLINFHISHRS